MNANLSLTDLSHPSGLVLAGTCGYHIEASKVVLQIAEIANNRNGGMISGTLSAELWALPRAYAGEGFEGCLLASARIGEIYDQHFITGCSYELDFQEPGEGTWHIALLLREWTADGLVTCDAINFAVPYVANTKPAIVRNEDSNVISVSFAENKKPASVKATATKEVASAAKAAAKPEKEKGQSEVCLNQASVEEIAAIKGVSKKLAENIVAGRPFDSWDGLLAVKGMGEKLLEKIRQFISL